MSGIPLMLPIRHKAIIASPLLTAMDLTPWLDATIEANSARPTKPISTTKLASI